MSDRRPEVATGPRKTAASIAASAVKIPLDIRELVNDSTPLLRRIRRFEPAFNRTVHRNGAARECDTAYVSALNLDSYDLAMREFLLRAEAIAVGHVGRTVKDLDEFELFAVEIRKPMALIGKACGDVRIIWDLAVFVEGKWEVDHGDR